MAVIKPFRGVRYNAEKTGFMDELICPPYDVISEAQRQELVEKNPFNIIRLELPKDEDGVCDKYDAAASLLKSWLDEGILVRDDKPSLYVYEEEYNLHGETRSVRGIICLTRLEEFEKGVILPHEQTLSKPKNDRYNLIKKTNSNLSPIYLLYSDKGRRTSSKLDTLTNCSPDVEVKEEKITHRVWIIDSELEIDAICRDFQNRKLYIADGHHRYETCLKYRDDCRANGVAIGSPCDYAMMLLVDMDNNKFNLFPTHRLIKNVPNFDVESILKSLEGDFRIDRHYYANSIKLTLNEYANEGRKAIAMYAGGDEWYLLKLRSNSSAMNEAMPNSSEALKNLDISVLHELVLRKVMDCNNEDCINYTRSFSLAISSVDSGEYQCCFILNPTRIDQLQDVIDAGEKMPQKSTYFFPKPTTGMVLNVFEN